eukprot:2801643-Prymnesium_polylepis.1
MALPHRDAPSHNPIRFHAPHPHPPHSLPSSSSHCTRHPPPRPPPSVGAHAGRHAYLLTLLQCHRVRLRPPRHLGRHPAAPAVRAPGACVCHRRPQRDIARDHTHATTHNKERHTLSSAAHPRPLPLHTPPPFLHTRRRPLSLSTRPSSTGRLRGLRAADQRECLHPRPRGHDRAPHATAAAPAAGAATADARGGAGRALRGGGLARRPQHAARLRSRLRAARHAVATAREGPRRRSAAGARA